MVFSMVSSAFSLVLVCMCINKFLPVFMSKIISSSISEFLMASKFIKLANELNTSECEISRPWPGPQVKGKINWLSLHPLTGRKASSERQE